MVSSTAPGSEPLPPNIRVVLVWEADKLQGLENGRFSARQAATICNVIFVRCSMYRQVKQQ